MAAFNYIALNAEGKEIKGVLEADSARQVRQSLREQSLTPLSVDAMINKKSITQTHAHSSIGLSQNDLALLTRQLATLIAAGIPLDECLTACAEQNEKAKLKQVILGVRTKVLEGHSLANALNDFPKTFSKLYRATIACGESSSHLDTILERLADYIEKQQATKQKVQQALIYPSIMTLVSIAIVTFLLIFVVPKMVSIFTSTHQQLPMATVILIAVSDFLKSYGLYLLILIIAFIAGFGYLIKSNFEFKLRVHKVLLKIPFIKHVIKTVNTARFSRTMGILSAASVPIIEAMHTACQLVTNLPMQQAIAIATTRVSEGIPISRALHQTNYFPAMSIHLIASGEKSGQLESMLERAANNQERDLNCLIDTLLSLFEPILILTMGAIVLFIVLAVLLPIFSLNQLTL